MKTSIILAITTAVIISFGSIFSSQKVPQAIFYAIENGDAKNLATYFNNNIDLIITDKSGIFNKKQAEILVKEFFDDNESTYFEVIEQKELLNSSFAICNFDSSSGEKYNVYIFVRKLSGKPMITKLKIVEL